MFNFVRQINIVFTIITFEDAFQSVQKVIMGILKRVIALKHAQIHFLLIILLKHVLKLVPVHLLVIFNLKNV